jgi:hypothetical protein
VVCFKDQLNPANKCRQLPSNGWFFEGNGTRRLPVSRFCAPNFSKISEHGGAWAG